MAACGKEIEKANYLPAKEIYLYFASHKVGMIPKWEKAFVDWFCQSREACISYKFNKELQ